MVTEARLKELAQQAVQIMYGQDTEEDQAKALGLEPHAVKRFLDVTHEMRTVLEESVEGVVAYAFYVGVLVGRDQSDGSQASCPPHYVEAG